MPSFWGADQGQALVGRRPKPSGPVSSLFTQPPNSIQASLDQLSSCQHLPTPDVEPSQHQVSSLPSYRLLPQPQLLIFRRFQYHRRSVGRPLALDRQPGLQPVSAGAVASRSASSPLLRLSTPPSSLPLPVFTRLIAAPATQFTSPVTCTHLPRHFLPSSASDTPPSPMASPPAPAMPSSNVPSSPQSPHIPSESKPCKTECISCALEAANASTLPVPSLSSPPARLTPRPFHHDLPPEAMTLWRWDLKNAFLGMHVPGGEPPLLWVECLDGHLMNESLNKWKTVMEKKPWTPSRRREMSRMALNQAQEILYYNERLHEGGPARGLLPTIRLLSLEDYSDTRLCASQDGLIASSKVMRECGYRIVRESEIEDVTYFAYT